MTWRGVFAGALGLIALQAMIQAPGRVGSMLTGVAGLVDRVLDPSVPAVPDLGAAAAAPGKKTPGIDSGTGSAKPYGRSGPNDPPGGFVPMSTRPQTPTDPQSVYT